GVRGDAGMLSSDVSSESLSIGGFLVGQPCCDGVKGKDFLVRLSERVLEAELAEVDAEV
ncbi:hypothetical protein C0991_004397, partial [Blastosporella zonata]